jgi:trimethylamine--corrinoid protein Co-methyltransferase
MVAFAGADFIHLAAGMLDSGNSISYEQYVIDDEIIGMTNRILAGVRVDADTLAEEVVARVGPGGQFMLEDHTVDHMMDEFAYPKLAVRENFDVWETAGRQSMLSRATDVVTEILSERTSRLEPAVRADLLRAFPDLRDPP